MISFERGMYRCCCWNMISFSFILKVKCFFLLFLFLHQTSRPTWPVLRWINVYLASGKNTSPRPVESSSLLWNVSFHSQPCWIPHVRSQHNKAAFGKTVKPKTKMNTHQRFCLNRYLSLNRRLQLKLPLPPEKKCVWTDGHSSVPVEAWCLLDTVEKKDPNW